MPFSKRKLLQVICLVAIILTVLLPGCSNKTKGPEQVVMKHIFYSSNKEGLEELYHFLEGGGYKIYDIQSFTVEGAEGWQFTASKILPVAEKAKEIEKINKLSELYHVNVKEEELPPEQWGGGA